MSVFVLSATLNNLIYKNMWIPRNYLCKMSLYKQKCTKFGPWPLHNRLHKYFHKMVDFSHSHNINFLFYILIFLDKLGKIYMLTKF